MALVLAFPLWVFLVFSESCSYPFILALKLGLCFA